jgi:class 3 adenylate cyclase/tetratricopeptide (TPR) repeat protein
MASTVDGMPTAEGQAGAVAAVKTLLLVDLVDSTGLISELGDSRAEEIFHEHDHLARSLLIRFDGREIDKTDGFLLLFDRPIQAVGYALEYQRELSRLGERRGLRLAARAGIHLGEVYLRGNLPAEIAQGAKVLEIEGLAKHMVARVAALAGPRQILLTHTAFDLARRAVVGETSSGRPRWLAHGPYLLKGIAEQVEIFEVGMSGFAPLSAPADTSKARRAVRAGDEQTLGWRPAVGLEVPWRHHWRVERKLGDGGFGEVWLARHEKTGDHRVFKFCYDAERLRALQREVTLFRILKDTLGERDDIGRILDWNFKEAPFFLEAEYSGTDLLGWVEEQGGAAAVPLATRLEIVAQVATALAAAHSVGVLHKDIKPSNVLIAVDAEGRPHARLADFGIGLLTDPKAVHDRGITLSGLTEMVSGSSSSGSAAGTRLYLAPELLEGRTPTIQSDVYALGVLLFQLVVGDLSHVLAPGWEREVRDPLLAEDIAGFVDGDPGKRPASALEVADRLRRLEARRQARADALRAERESEEMRAALVRARRRRRLLAGFTSLVLLFSVAMALQMRRTAREAARANREAETARRVSEFLVGLFEVADPDVALGDTVTARELLDQGAGRIEAELRDQPEVQAALMHTMGRAYLKLGLYEPAAGLFRQALAVRRRGGGGELPAVADTLTDLASSLVLQGRYDEAEPLLDEALALRRRIGGKDDGGVARTLRQLAALKLERGDYSRAEALYREVLAIQDANGIQASPERGETLSDLAVLLEYQGKNESVEETYDEALALWRRIGGPEHTSVAVVLSNQGKWLTDQGRYAEAAACFEQGLAIRRKRLGDRHPLVAVLLYKLASLHNLQGQHARAEALARESAGILEQRLPPGHWRKAYADRILGTALAGQGRYAEAEPFLVGSYPVVAASRGAQAKPTQEIAASLVSLYEKWGRPEKASRYRSRP